MVMRVITVWQSPSNFCFYTLGHGVGAVILLVRSGGPFMERSITLEVESVVCLVTLLPDIGLSQGTFKSWQYLNLHFQLHLVLFRFLVQFINVRCILFSYFKIKLAYMSGSLIWTWMQCMFKMSNGIGLHKLMNGYWRHDNGLIMVFHWSRAGFTCEWHWQYHWLYNIPFIHRPKSHSFTTPAFLDQLFPISERVRGKNKLGKKIKATFSHDSWNVHRPCNQNAGIRSVWIVLCFFCR